MTVNITLQEIINNDVACKELGLNPWCINEGADSTAEYRINIDDAIKWGLIEKELIS